VPSHRQRFQTAISFEKDVPRYAAPRRRRTRSQISVAKIQTTLTAVSASANREVDKPAFLQPATPGSHRLRSERNSSPRLNRTIDRRPTAVSNGAEKIRRVSVDEYTSPRTLLLHNFHAMTGRRESKRPVVTQRFSGDCEEQRAASWPPPQRVRRERKELPNGGDRLSSGRNSAKLIETGDSVSPCQPERAMGPAPHLAIARARVPTSSTAARTPYDRTP